MILVEIVFNEGLRLSPELSIEMDARVAHPAQDENHDLVSAHFVAIRLLDQWLLVRAIRSSSFYHFLSQQIFLKRPVGALERFRHTFEATDFRRIA